MITKEELRAYHDIKLEISVIEREIQSLYYPVSSVPMSSEGGHSSTPSNPTEAAVFKIDDKRKKLKAKQAELQDIIDRIDDWVNTLDDHLAASIIRLHFICCLMEHLHIIKVHNISRIKTDSVNIKLIYPEMNYIANIVLNFRVLLV